MGTGKFATSRKRIEKIYYHVYSIHYRQLWDFFFNYQKFTFYKSAFLKIYFVTQFVIVGRDKFNRYLRYTNHYGF